MGSLNSFGAKASIGSNNTTNVNNSTTNVTNVNTVPSEKQKAAGARRLKKAALLQKKQRVLKHVSKQFRDPFVFTLNPGSLSDALDNYAQRQSVMADIELNFSAQTQQQAELFFDNARKAIACAWGESNRPATCQVNNAQHPDKKYQVLFASLRKNMRKEIAAAAQ